MYTLRVTPVVGLPHFDGWSHVASTSDQHTVMALAVHGLNARNIGRELVSLIEETVVTTASELHTIVQQLHDQSQDAGAQLSIAAISSVNGQGFYAAINGSIVLKRGEKVGSLLTAGENLEFRQGSTQEGEMVVALTTAADTLQGEIKQKLIQGYDADTIVTSIVPAVHQDALSAEMAIACVAMVPTAPVVSEAEVEVETEPEVPSSPITSVEDLRSPDIAGDSVFESADAASTVPATSPPPESELEHDLDIVAAASLLPRPPVPVKPLQVKLTRVLGPLQKNLLKVGHSLRENVMTVTARRPRVSLGNVSNLVQKYSAKLVGLAPILRRRARLVTVVLVAVGLLTIGAVVASRWYTQQVGAAEAVLMPFSTRLSDAQELATTNPLLARTTVETIVAELQQLHQQQRNWITKRVVTTELETAQGVLATLSGENVVSVLPVFVDLHQLAPDWVGQKLDADASHAAILDPERKSIALLDLSSKQLAAYTALSLPADQVVRDLMVSDGRATILANGLYQVPTSDAATPSRELKPAGDSNREATLVASFGPYYYVVNPERRNIYRYTESKAEISDPIGWLVPGERLAFEEITSIAVDGEVWLGTKIGEVWRMSGGTRDEFALSGLSEALSNPVMIYTKDFLSHLYILDPVDGRLVMITKDGAVVREWRSQSLVAATDLVASESLGKVLVLNGSVIFEVSLAVE